MTGAGRVKGEVPSKGGGGPRTTRTRKGPVTPVGATLFGLFLGVVSAVLLAVGAAWSGYGLTPARAAAYVAIGAGLAYVGAKGLLVV